MLFLKIIVRHAFHWMVVAGLLIVAHTVTSDRRDFADENPHQTWGSQLGLTEMPPQKIAVSH